MKAKIITQEKAFKMGLTTNNKGGGRGSNSFFYGVVSNKKKKKIEEVFKINTKTNEREIIYEDKEYKKLKKKLKINEYKEKEKREDK